MKLKWISALIGCFVAIALAEILIRWLLFSNHSIATRLGARIRNPSVWASPRSDAFWKLQHIFLGSAAGPAHGPDAEIGWVAGVDPLTAEHPDEVAIRGRRPVLLFGDSFAQCTTPPGECFQSLLEGSPLSNEYCLLNYGVGGYGFDQICLLARRVVPRFLDRNPKVIVAVMMDDDFHRSALSFRCWPKSHARLVNGQLLVTPAGSTDPARHLEQNPVPVTSWAWQMGMALSGQAIEDDASRLSDADLEALNRALLDALDDQLRQWGIEYSFLFFNAQQTLSGNPSVSWTTRLVDQFRVERDAPCVSTLPYLIAGGGGSAAEANNLFGSSGRDLAHYTPGGNKVAFEALRQAIIDPRGQPDLRHVEYLYATGALRSHEARTRRLPILPCESTLTTRSALPLVRLLPSPPDEPGKRIRMGATHSELTEWSLVLGGRFQKLSFTIQQDAGMDNECPHGVVLLDALLDERPCPGLPVEIRPGEPSRGIDLPLEGGRALRLTLRVPPGQQCGWVQLGGLKLE